MRPFQPRLIRESRAAQRLLALAVAASLIGAASALTIALVLSRLLADAVQGRSDLSRATSSLALVAGLALVRGGSMWVAEYAGHLGARDVIASLRSRLLRSLAARGPEALQGTRSGALATAATTGIESLDTYFARYLPQLVLGTAIPVMVLVFLALSDPLSAAIVAVTLPLIPLFMWLVGAAAQHRMDSRWALLQRLGAYFLDVIQGLPTLRIFGRAGPQVERVRAVTEASRRATMGTLALAFLSAMVLETLSSLATAIVAAEIGVRLVDGTMTLQTGLAVLIVVPEAYMPLRQMGAFFHASMEGISAATTVLDLADTVPAVEPGRRLPVPLADDTISLVGVTCIHGERGEGLITPVTCSIPPRSTTLITGKSGAGKTTLLGLLLRFNRPTAGKILFGAHDLGDLDVIHWRDSLGWVPQHPVLFPGTILDNLRLAAPNVALRSLGRPTAPGWSGAAEDEAAALLRRLFPDGAISLSTPVFADGEGLSGGERMRIALARALLRSPRLLLLDEPTSFLDPRSAIAVVSLLQEVAGTTTLLIATHEPERFSWARGLIELDGAAAPVRQAEAV